VIPHVIALVFLWIAFVVLTVVAFFAIMFTGRYPRTIFDFNVGVLRWTWRVGFYSYSALGTDRYPPFTLADVPTTRRGWPSSTRRRSHAAWSSSSGGCWRCRTTSSSPCSPEARGAVGTRRPTTGRYPKAIFDFVMGMNRWVYRVAAYAALMTDAYPPFRLDMGGHESAPDAAGTEAISPKPAPAVNDRPPPPRLPRLRGPRRAGARAHRRLVEPARRAHPATADHAAIRPHNSALSRVAWTVVASHHHAAAVVLREAATKAAPCGGSTLAKVTTLVDESDALVVRCDTCRRLWPTTRERLHSPQRQHDAAADLHTCPVCREASVELVAE
jgi:hypothetical protein